MSHHVNLALLHMKFHHQKCLSPSRLSLMPEVRQGIIFEIRLHCLMRYLAGGSYLDICTLVSIPHSTFYYILWKTCNAINDCPQLEFSLPCREAELKDASAGFEGISCQGIIKDFFFKLVIEQLVVS
jgi:hypothetical protein